MKVKKGYYVVGYQFQTKDKSGFGSGSACIPASGVASPEEFMSQTIEYIKSNLNHNLKEPNVVILAVSKIA